MANAKRATGAQRAGGSRGRSLLKRLGIVVVALAVLGAASFGVAYAITPIPDPNADFQTNITKVYFRDGTTELGNFAVQNRVSIPYEDMPQSIREAIVAAENETFWTDPGISVAGLARAVVSALGPGDTVGGSTLTQQYVKVLYLSQEKTITRKLKEIVIALKVGQEVSKEEILAGYLNTVYFGRGTYGVQAAAQVYFGIDAKDLTLSQAVALAAIINSPGNLDPAKGDKQRADLLERYQYTLNQMVKTGKLSEAERDALYRVLPEFPDITRDSRFGGPKGYVLRMVQDELEAAGFDESEINGGGFHVITTIDEAAQEAAVKAAQDAATRAAAVRKKDPAQLHPAIASVDVATGGVLALYGGSDYVENNRNWATTPRPTGSTFKPWALVAALRNGATLNDMYNGNSYTPRGEGVPVTNAGGRDYGPVSLIKATTSSINSAYVDVVAQMADGPNKVIKAANDAGIPTGMGWEPNNRIALGTAEVSPLAAAGGFATLANGGKRITPHVVTEVKDPQGNTIWQPTHAATQTIEENVARDAVYALTNVTSSGTGRSVSSLGYQIGGKTGTRYDAALDETKASWFVGFTAQISTAVMFVAGDDGNGNLDEFSSGFYGSGYPASTWLAYMRVAQKGLPRVNFPGPTVRISTQKPTFTSTPTPTPDEEGERTPGWRDDQESAEPTRGPGAGDATQEPTSEATSEATSEPTSSRGRGQDDTEE